MSWPTTDGKADIDYMVWSTGTSALKRHEIALYGGLHDIEATCKRDIFLLLGVSKAEVGETFAASSSHIPEKWLMSSLSSVALRVRARSSPPPHALTSLKAPSACLYQKTPSPPPSPTIPYSHYTDTFLPPSLTSFCAVDTSYPPPYLDPLSWENIQSRSLF